MVRKNSARNGSPKTDEEEVTDSRESRKSRVVIGGRVRAECYGSRHERAKACASASEIIRLLGGVGEISSMAATKDEQGGELVSIDEQGEEIGELG
ncbi:hypothetical protein CJ030_MR6G003923 [Morella rubra]|uniref:Uncharacterized protein n=1 Tax=Morella rubra TaxID=262757 RepID=A0A6A1VBQ5_9ROSI|nr:hypothetical protein CJ030_MR6G003923 [Morella rubra]